jgi:hypothetical protein
MKSFQDLNKFNNKFLYINFKLFDISIHMNENIGSALFQSQYCNAFYQCCTWVFMKGSINAVSLTGESSNKMIKIDN